MPKTVPALPGLQEGHYPFSQIVEANGFVFLAGQVGDVPGKPGAAATPPPATDPGPHDLPAQEPPPPGEEDETPPPA